MTDPRYTKLAKLLVNYSTEIKKGDPALLDMIDVPDEFAIELMRAVRAASAARRWSKSGTPASPGNCCAAPTNATPRWSATWNCCA